MRIYNGTNSQVDLPLAGSQRITIAPKSVSGDIMSSTEFISILVTSYSTDELALVISGPFEINQCASIPTAVEYVCQSLDEAVQRFAPTVEPEEVVEEEVKEEEVVNEELESPTTPVLDDEIKEEKPEENSLVENKVEEETTKEVEKSRTPKKKKSTSKKK